MVVSEDERRKGHAMSWARSVQYVRKRIFDFHYSGCKVVTESPLRSRWLPDKSFISFLLQCYS